MHESQLYLLTGTIIEEISKTLHFLSTYNHEKKGVAMERYVTIVTYRCGYAIRETVCNNVVTMCTANGDAV
jgi:hypothetical protein